MWQSTNIYSRARTVPVHKGRCHKSRQTELLFFRMTYCLSKLSVKFHESLPVQELVFQTLFMVTNPQTDPWNVGQAGTF